MDYWRKQLEQAWDGAPPPATEEGREASSPPGPPEPPHEAWAPPTPPARPPAWGPPTPPQQAPATPPQQAPEPPARPAARPPSWQSQPPTVRPQPPQQPWTARPQPAQQPWSPQPIPQTTRQQPVWQPPPFPVDEGDERAARVAAGLLGVGVAALVVGLVVFFTVRTLRTDDASPVLEGPPVTTPEDAARVAGGLGPPAGTEVVTYVNARKEALGQATGDRVAVVSLQAYTTEGKARALVGQAEVVALLAAAPSGQPAVVTTSLREWVTAQTAEARTERDEIQRLIPTAQNDPAFQAFYRTEVERLNKLINAVKPDGNLVFGVVVRAPAAALQQVGASSDVRVVDVGPDGATEASAYRGLRPEETSKANEPNTRPA